MWYRLPNKPVSECRAGLPKHHLCKGSRDANSCTCNLSVPTLPQSCILRPLTVHILFFSAKSLRILYLEFVQHIKSNWMFRAILYSMRREIKATFPQVCWFAKKKLDTQRKIKRKIQCVLTDNIEKYSSIKLFVKFKRQLNFMLVCNKFCSNGHVTSSRIHYTVFKKLLSSLKLDLVYATFGSLYIKLV